MSVLKTWGIFFQKVHTTQHKRIPTERLETVGCLVSAKNQLDFISSLISALFAFLCSRHWPSSTTWSVWSLQLSSPWRPNKQPTGWRFDGFGARSMSCNCDSSKSISAPWLKSNWKLFAFRFGFFGSTTCSLGTSWSWTWPRLAYFRCAGGGNRFGGAGDRLSAATWAATWWSRLNQNVEIKVEHCTLPFKL